MAINASRRILYADVEFHTADKLYAVNNQTTLNDGIPSKDLVAVTTQKDMNNPTGTFQLTLTAARGSDGMDWYDRLDTNNLVVIKMGQPPEIMGTIMVGLIDEIRRVKTMGSNGQPQRQIIVRGSDFGKILSRAMLVFYPMLANDPSLADNSFYKTTGGWQAMVEFFTGKNGPMEGKPAELIQQALIQVLFRIINVKFPYWSSATGLTNIHLSNILRYLLADSTNIIPFFLTMLDYEGTFWNFIEQASLKPFNELFIDTRGFLPDGTQEYMQMVPNLSKSSYYPAGDPNIAYMAEKGIDTNPNWSASFGEDKAKVILFLRNTPFDYTDWNNLYTHTISYDEIITEDLGRSDQDMYTSFMAYNALSVPTDFNLKLLTNPIIDPDGAELYGMIPLDVEIQGIDMSPTNQDDGVVASKALSQKLYDWYKLNRYYKNGTVTVKGNAFYRVGQRLLIQGCEYNRFTGQWDDLVFYVEGVKQDFNVMDSWQTTLTLTRGQRTGTTQPSGRVVAAGTDGTISWVTYSD